MEPHLSSGLGFTTVAFAAAFLAQSMAGSCVYIPVCTGRSRRAQEWRNSLQGPWLIHVTVPYAHYAQHTWATGRASGRWEFTRNMRSRITT